MSDYHASTTISLNVPDAVKSTVSLTVLPSGDSEVVRVACSSNKLQKVRFDTFDCRILKKDTVVVFTEEYFTFTKDSTMQQLQYHPYRISKVEILAGVQRPVTIDRSYVSVSGVRNGDLVYLKVVYEYQRIELQLQYESSGPFSGHKDGGNIVAYGALTAYIPDETVASTVLSFSYAVPNLIASSSLDSGKVVITATSIRSSNIPSVHFLFLSGGTVVSSEVIQETVVENVTFTEGTGYTSSAIFSIDSYDILNGSGRITVSPGANNNKLEFTGTSGSFGGETEIGNVSASVTYTTRKMKFVIAPTSDVVSFTLTDAEGNQYSDKVTIQSTGGETIAVKVYDFYTGIPLQGAKVTIADKVVITDMNGIAEFTGLPKGTYRVVIEKDGYIRNIDDNIVNEVIDV